MKPAGSTGKAEQTRQRILDAAAAVFALRGFAATSLADIAAAAGMKSGSLYFHFASKDALVGEVLSEGMSRSLGLVEAAVERAGAAAGGRARLRAAIHAHVDALSSLAGYAASVLRTVEEVSPEIRSAFRSNERAYADHWASLIVAAQADGWLDGKAEAKQVRRILFGAMNALDPRGSRPRAPAAGKALLLALLGLAPEAAGAASEPGPPTPPA